MSADPIRETTATGFRCKQCRESLCWEDCHASCPRGCADPLGLLPVQEPTEEPRRAD